MLQRGGAAATGGAGPNLNPNPDPDPNLDPSPNPNPRCNVGYAFINFISTTDILPFYEEFNHKKWDRFNSDKV